MAVILRGLNPKRRFGIASESGEGIFRLPGLHLESVVVIALSDGFDQVQNKEEPEAVPTELLHMLQLVKNPTAVGQELFSLCVVQMDGSTEGQSHGVRPENPCRTPGPWRTLLDPDFPFTPHMGLDSRTTRCVAPICILATFSGYGSDIFMSALGDLFPSI